MSIAARIIDLTATHLLVEPERVIPEASIIDDLGGDSLDTAELLMLLEDEFSIEITDDEGETLHTVGDMIRLIERRTGA